jgi:hypothetical protein
MDIMLAQLWLLHPCKCGVTVIERPLMARSSRTGADRERQQRIGYDAFAEPTTNERNLREADLRRKTENFRSGSKAVQLIGF